MKQTKILIVDDHKVVRLGLKALFETEKDLRVVGEARDGLEAISLAASLKPDVIVMDILMPGLGGIEATREIVKADAGQHILVLTSISSSDGVSAALEAGALGAVSKSAEDSVILNALKKVAKGERFIQPEIASMMAEDPPVPKLTPRQLEVLASMTRGLTNKDIARQLGLCETRVIQHVNALLEKIGAANRTEAVAIALRKHLLKI